MSLPGEWLAARTALLVRQEEWEEPKGRSAGPNFEN
jgi:hypothetical protein